MDGEAKIHFKTSTDLLRFLFRFETFPSWLGFFKCCDWIRDFERLLPGLIEEL